MVQLYYDPIFLQHETRNHPECGDRIVPAARRLNLLAMHMGCSRPAWEPLTIDALRLVHDSDYIDFIERQCASGGGELDPDTVVSPRSFEVALWAAGAVADAVEKVLHSNERQAFCLVRPPGHHAFASRAAGGCLFNNVAVGARLAIVRHGLPRVLIVDWDVHHGDGTQAIFWKDAQVGFLSIHRFPFYPGTGDAGEAGGGAARGTKLNVPIELGTSRQEYLTRFAAAVKQIAARMRPELVLISAGFDAHRLDPIGSLGLESDDFRAMTRDVVQVAKEHAGGRIVSVLEGGYHPEAVADCVDGHVYELMRVEQS